MSKEEIAVFAALAERWRPPPATSFAGWLEENIVLVDGPAAGRLWSRRGAPYLAEIADCLNDDAGHNLVTVRKAQQCGASILALAWTLFIADREPANTLYAAPTLDALRDLNSGKLAPLIDAWQRRTGREIIKPATSRSAAGSSTYEKVFPRGKLWLANANVAMELSSKTVKKGVKDEVSKWKTLENGADPETLFFGRFTAFRRSGDYKILEISTPEVDFSSPEGLDPEHCRIDRSFRASDQRFWHVPCPQCSAFFVHDVKFFRLDEDDPAKSAAICPACGYPIGDSERPAMILAGEWRAAAPGADRHPGFHIDAFISLMMSYEAIGRDLIKSRRGGEIAAKDFANLVLGLPYRFHGQAPDHERLMERREEHLKRGHIPPEGVILIAGADVQARGIWVEVVAFAETRESWTVEALYLDGDTAEPDGEAYKLLEQRVLERDWPDAWGKTRRIDALAIDSGFHSHAVYSWTRAKQRVSANGHEVLYAVKGLEGWGRPPLGSPSLVDIDLAGQRVRKGARVWGVGAWPLKSAFFADLSKRGKRSGEASDPPGYCHFGAWLDEGYFRQLTSEYLATEVVRGRPRKVWRLISGTRDNHWLDCRIYALALAEHLGLSTLTDDEWKALRRERCGAAAAPQMDLFRAATLAVEAAAADVAAERTRQEKLMKANAERFR